MDYDELVKELSVKMQSARSAGLRKQIYDSNQGELYVLFSIRDRQGTTVPGDISSALNISSARVAAALNSLEEKELITRRINVDDRRKIIVELTPKGVEYLEERQREHFERIKSILVQLGEKDAKELVRILGRIAEVLDKRE